MRIPRRNTFKLLALLSVAGAALAPAAAMAANECAPIGVDPSVNGSTADTYACAGAYASGITYSSAGALTVNSTGAMNVGATGINLTGNGADAVIFTSTGIVTGTDGPAIDVTSVSGPINLQTAGVTANTGTATHGIRARSTGGGAITITTNGVINANSATVTTAVTGIEAISTGGNGAVSLTTTGNITGRIRGIQAQSSGTGALTITVNGNAAVNNTLTGGGVGQVAAIDARSGTGLLTINVANVGGFAPINGFTGSAVLANAGGNLRVDLGAGRNVLSLGATAATLDLTAVGTITLNNDAQVNITGVGTNDQLNGRMLRAAGGSLVFNNNSRTTGTLDLSGLGGTSAITNASNGNWRTSGLNTFAPGQDTLANAGIIVVNNTLAGGANTVFADLETVNNTGVIVFGGTESTFTAVSDDTANDVLSIVGAAFTGSGNSRLLMDISVAEAVQTNCGAVTVSDCLVLTGGATSGVTEITVNDVGGTLESLHSPTGILLVDVNGGTSHAGDFVIDPDSDNYAIDPVLGGVIRKPGLFTWALSYDAATQQHFLVGLPRGEALEFMPFVHGAQSIWHTTADTLVERQADLRAGGEGGVWFRAAGDYTSRDFVQTYENHGNSYSFNQDYSLYAGTVAAGFDVATGSYGEGDYVIGVSGGYVGGTLDIDSSASSDQIAGASAGVYGGWWNEKHYLDVALNSNFLGIEHDVPALTDSTTNVVSLGLRAETGMRMALSGRAFIEPLASLAYVHTTIEDVELREALIAFDDGDSLRGAVGLRIGADWVYDAINVSYWATGKAWNEFQGQNGLTIENTGEPLTLQDDLGGTFGEVVVGASLHSTDNRLRGFLASGVKFKEGLQTINLSAGIRFRW